MNEHIRTAVIMAGGSGERFWPLSRAHRPKQLLRLSSPTETMLEEAVARVAPLVDRRRVFVSTSLQLKPHIEEAGLVPPENILAEPAKRNTLGALVWTAAELLSRDFEAERTSVAILTADHKIAPREAFLACVTDALAIAETSGGLVTIGIEPTRPETGFGYIEAALDEPIGAGYRALSFREKPEPAVAEQFLRAGNFFWNSGMFFFTLAGFLAALRETRPEAAELALAIAEALRAGDSTAATALFEGLPNVSFDYAVMERARNVAAVPSSFEWDDLGAWDALERALPCDAAGSVVQGDVVVVDSEGCIVYNDDPDAVVSVLGMRDVIVVATKDAVLVCPKAQAQRVKEIVALLNARKG